MLGQHMILTTVANVLKSTPIKGDPLTLPSIPIMAQSTISLLARLISSSVAALERVCEDNQLSLPDLDAPKFYKSSEAFRVNPAAAEAARIAAAACLQLSAALLPPTEVVYQLVVGVRLD